MRAPDLTIQLNFFFFKKLSTDLCVYFFPGVRLSAGILQMGL